MTASPNAWQRILFSAAIGAGFAALPTIAIALLLLLDGRHIRLGATVIDGFVALGLYPLGAVLVGRMLVLLAPLARWVWSAVLCGIVAIAPLLGAVYLSTEGASCREDGVIVLATSVVFG